MDYSVNTELALPLTAAVSSGHAENNAVIVAEGEVGLRLTPNINPI
jgi:hypothetical protein